MATTYGRATADISTAQVTVYTCPALTTTSIIGFQISNVAAGQILVDINVGGKSFGKDIPIPSGSSLSVLDGQLVLVAGDVLTVQSNTVDSAEVFVSYMEMT